MADTHSQGKPLRVLMVCLGNICRSPTAQGVLQKLIDDKGLAQLIEVDSAGTGDWHIGKNPDPRAVAAAQVRGYEIESLVGRQVEAADFARFDYLLCMDRNNLNTLRLQSPNGNRSKIKLLMDFSQSSDHDTVPDPYYSGQQGFELVLDLLEDACTQFVSYLQDEHELQPGKS